MVEGCQALLVITSNLDHCACVELNMVGDFEQSFHPLITTFRMRDSHHSIAGRPKNVLYGVKFVPKTRMFRVISPPSRAKNRSNSYQKVGDVAMWL